MNIEAILGYHAHIYYQLDTRSVAEELRTRMEELFPAGRYGRWHDKPVGPHPSAMFQVAFDTDLFATMVPWLMLNHGPLTIFVHPETGDDLTDHAEHAVWIGRQQVLKLDQFMPHK
ncbi:MAG: 4,5-dioxygenase [Hyphomicrobiales bacterium]|nr:4,5-dioxygenase [Hyphomicrobiales bacterium]